MLKLSILKMMRNVSFKHLIQPSIQTYLWHIQHHHIALLSFHGPWTFHQESILIQN